MKKVIVTGARGFIGRHALNTLLERGFEVHAITSRDLPNDACGCYWYKANLLEVGKIQQLVTEIGASHLLHFAWYAVPGKYWTAEENFSWVQASLELLKWFEKSGGERVVMAGTCAEYDWNYGYCSELITPTNPNSPYGICKLGLHNLLRSYSELTGISSAWGRIFWLYGCHEYSERLVPYVIQCLLEGKVAKCSHANQIRDFLYVQDVADAFVELLISNVKGSVNIASGKPLALKEIIFTIAHQIGREDLIQLGAISSSPKEVPFIVADGIRLLNEVGWQPKYTLDKGIRETIKWWKG